MRETEPRTMLPHAAPASPYRRLLLFAIRRMAVGGIGDAHAAHAMFTGFGLGYRRPLVLLRALMAELARVAATKLTVAPCCCTRMTHDEAMLLELIAESPASPEAVHEAMRGMLQTRTCLGALMSAQAVAVAFHDLGMPLQGDCVSRNRDDPFLNGDKA
ncbi:DUF6628 family protein [Sphingomonas crusticola]|uniref:DUF6628 family protein n=1 Tax=Sphingomonas crusticola TaxID=1697973 RepID=UPI0019683097|nr:DUF6628 family protein [Sphingomonas crusticola]